MPNLKTASPARSAPHGGPVQLFYQGNDAIRRPIVARAEGIYMWDTDGRRYIDASSGPVVSNIGHGNPRVLAAMIEQAQKVAFASRTVFENEPNAKLADLITGLAGPGLERAYFVSGGSEATETAIKIARQYAVVKGEARRWKVIGRDPGYHGATLGAASVTGDPQAEKTFAPLMPVMPKVPAPFTYRLPPNHDADSYARACAGALEDTIRREGAETVLAFIMEPVGGLATGALVAPDHYYRAVREICGRGPHRLLSRRRALAGWSARSGDPGQGHRRRLYADGSRARARRNGRDDRRIRRLPARPHLRIEPTLLRHRSCRRQRDAGTGPDGECRADGRNAPCPPRSAQGDVFNTRRCAGQRPLAGNRDRRQPRDQGDLAGQVEGGLPHHRVGDRARTPALFTAHCGRQIRRMAHDHSATHRHRGAGQ